MTPVSENEYVRRIQSAVDFIEEHLSEDLALSDAAEKAHWSAFHFMRTFDAVIGMTFREYVRLRRMEIAAYNLKFTDRRILDIAIDVGYETQEAFTRAFRASYGTSPKRYRDGEPYSMHTMRARVVIPKSNDDRRILMEPRIVRRERTRLMGAELRTRNDGNNDNGIAEFWERFHKEGTAARIENKVQPNVSYGLCTNVDTKTGDFSYVIGYEVVNEGNIPKGLGEFLIEASEYAVFTARGRLQGDEFPKAIQEMWKYAYGEWFPQSRNWDRGEGPDFELYDDERFSGSHGECDIYIPVRHK